MPELEAAGCDVVWAGEWSEDPGDEEILARAHRATRIVVTLDKDFGELAVVRRVPHSGIIRLVDLSVTAHARTCLEALDRHYDDLAAGGIVTVHPGRIRLRPAPL